jgi:4-alpha-glucanotransferase
MQFARLDRHFTGVSVPVAALRTGSSCGVGEFGDLVGLGRFCRASGLEVIQVLPVNDTGSNSSPYSALSAFALHPLYLHLDTLPGAQRYADRIAAFKAEAAAREAASVGGPVVVPPGAPAEEAARRPREAPGPGRPRFSYRHALDFKLSIVELLFADNERAVAKDASFARWRRENPWVVPYAVFTALRKRAAGAPWWSWHEGSDEPDPAMLAAWWKDHPSECLPTAWTQYHLERQLADASRALAEMGVFLKGDLPILMCTDSADVWADRRYFDLSARAGAPPDMFSPDGQNWGFPVYDWEALGRGGYGWWKQRLAQAAKFFHAFRIDHVLGFFRIWRIPRGEVTGLLGRFSPSAGLTAADSLGLGWDDGMIRWLTLPHVSGTELAGSLGPDARRVADSYLLRIGNEELYNIRPEVDGEQAILGLDEPRAVKDFLLARHVDRTLLDDGAGVRFPAWYLETKKGFRSLSDAQRAGLAELLGRKRAESERDWERRGRDLLDVIRGSAAGMLVCAEDLGDVPRCVPVVLADLGILGLRILRWARDWDAPGQPFVPPDRYPWLSVSTPSVHDTSTLRAWWEEGRQEREGFFAAMGRSGPCPDRLTPDLLRRVVGHCCSAGSALCIFQLQDLMDLDEELWAPDPRSDRINVPGTVNDWNWTWRMPLPVEELASREQLTGRIAALARGRRERAPRREA